MTMAEEGKTRDKARAVFYDDPWQYFNAMLNDLSQARESICIETYKYSNDAIGERFRNVLIQKASKGVKVRLLIDSWGAQVSQSFFRELTEAGGEVRFFMKIKFFIDLFTKNHRRNHRKFLLIDDHISYIGSANISGYSLNWCESMLRLDDKTLNKQLLKVFNQDFNLYNRYTFKKPHLTRLIRSGNFEIIRDVPSITRQKIKKKYVAMFRAANKRVVVESPYFLPGFMLRKAMTDAVKRGVEVIVITPLNSDVHMVDLVRGRYLGMLHRNGVKFLLYAPHNLHAKLMLVDDRTFAIGSANFDYRSFRYQHEIIMVGEDEEISSQILTHIDTCMQNSVPFNYDEWLRRPFLQRFFEWLFLPFRHLF